MPPCWAHGECVRYGSSRSCGAVAGEATILRRIGRCAGAEPERTRPLGTPPRSCAVTRSGRTTRAQAGEATSRRRKLGAALLLLAGLFGGMIGFASTASAHHPALATADVGCSSQTPGGWTVTGTSTAWPGSPSQRAHNDIDIYWGPASVTWPTTSATVPAGAILGVGRRVPERPGRGRARLQLPLHLRGPRDLRPR